VAAVIGSPVSHSLSPAIHNAAFAACGLDWVYLAFDVGLDAAAAAIGGCQALGVRGLSVTMPLKTAVAAALGELSPTAATLGAVNTVVFDTGRPAVAIGHNTDGAGFLAALSASLGWSPVDRRCVVLGAGGAARAVVLALAQVGAAEVVVVNRSQEPAGLAAHLAGPVGRVGAMRDVGDADLVVNATPVGMGGTPWAERSPVDPSLLNERHVVVDLVYYPVMTPLLRAAAARGAICSGGLGMLVHQAALQFGLWTGADAPVDDMSTSVSAAITERIRAVGR